MKSLSVIKVFVSILLIVSCTTHCLQVEELYKSNMSGIINSKSVNGRGHRLVSFDKYNYNNLSYLYVLGDRSGLWNYIDIGDSVYKDANTFKVNVKRKHMIKTFRMKFPNCSNQYINKVFTPSEAPCVAKCVP